MRITFIGTSHGVPEPNRRCSSAMVTLGQGEASRRYFIDMGTQSIEDLITMGVAIESVRAIFLTHMHGDHTNGVISFIDLCSWYFKKAEPEVYFPEEDAIPYLKGWLSANSTKLRDEIKFKTVSEGVVYDDGFLKVTARRTKHCRTSYAYLIEAEGKRVIFSGDLSGKGPQEDFPLDWAIQQKVNLAICETAHFDANKYEPLFRQAMLDRVIINHYSHFLIETDYQLMRLMPDLDISLATDDMEIEL